MSVAFLARRRAPVAGEVGSLAACPLCEGASPPCLACRDELRARFIELGLTGRVEAALN